MLRPGALRPDALTERGKTWGEERLRLTQLSARLGDDDWLDGTFSAGDLLMVSVLMRLGSPILDEFPSLSAFMARGQARPAYERAFAAQLKVFREGA